MVNLSLCKDISYRDGKTCLKGRNNTNIWIWCQKVPRIAESKLARPTKSTLHIIHSDAPQYVMNTLKSTRTMNWKGNHMIVAYAATKELGPLKTTMEKT